METRLLVEIIHDNDLENLAQCLRAYPDQLHQTDQRGENAMAYAITRGRVECVRILLPFYDLKELCITSTSYGEAVNALTMAAGFSQMECLQELLPHFDPNARTARRRTALMHACFAGWAAGVRVLMEVSDVNALDWDRRNALMHAIDADAVECVQLLAPLTDFSTLCLDAKLSVMTSCMRRGRWACALALAPFFPLEAIRSEFKLSPRQGGEELLAWVERQLLNAHLSESGGAASASTPSRSTGPSAFDAQEACAPSAVQTGVHSRAEANGPDASLSSIAMSSTALCTRTSKRRL